MRLALATQWGEQSLEEHTQTKGKGVIHEHKGHKVAQAKVIGWLRQVRDLQVRAGWLCGACGRPLSGHQVRVSESKTVAMSSPLFFFPAVFLLARGEAVPLIPFAALLLLQVQGHAAGRSPCT